MTYMYVQCLYHYITQGHLGLLGAFVSNLASNSKISVRRMKLVENFESG